MADNHPNGMSEAEGAKHFGFDDIEDFRAWWKLENPDARAEFEQRSHRFKDLDRELRSELGFGLLDLFALIKAAQAKAFAGPKVKEAASAIPEPDPVLEKWIGQQQEKAAKAEAERKEKERLEALWAEEEAKEKAAIEAREAERRARAETKVKKAKAAFSPEQIEALRGILGNAGEISL
ncbi:hypothetical protein [Nitratireductor luteus]|uniref:hypothetical protein n=1 Tax=Nitratireductor luteus TaxID=2976980 RepID=UPI00223F768F|nr:hypothetical protein [Nitratireductor luteus]